MTSWTIFLDSYVWRIFLAIALQINYIIFIPKNHKTLSCILVCTSTSFADPTMSCYSPFHLPVLLLLNKGCLVNDYCRLGKVKWMSNTEAETAASLVKVYTTVRKPLNSVVSVVQWWPTRDCGSSPAHCRNCCWLMLGLGSTAWGRARCHTEQEHLCSPLEQARICPPLERDILCLLQEKDNPCSWSEPLTF